MFNHSHIQRTGIENNNYCYIAIGVEKSGQISDLDQEVKRLWDNLRKVFVIVPVVVGALSFVSNRNNQRSFYSCVLSYLAFE